MREGFDRLKNALMPFAIAYDQAEIACEGPCLDLVETRRMYETPSVQDFRRASEAFASVDWDFTKIPADTANKIERFQRDRSEWFSAPIREILSEYEEWRAAQGMAGEAPRREGGSAPSGAPSPVANGDAP
jgi:hypothetical protein